MRVVCWGLARAFVASSPKRPRPDRRFPRTPPSALSRRASNQHDKGRSHRKWLGETFDFLNVASSGALASVACSTCCVCVRSGIYRVFAPGDFLCVNIVSHLNSNAVAGTPGSADQRCVSRSHKTSCLHNDHRQPHCADKHFGGHLRRCYSSLVFCSGLGRRTGPPLGRTARPASAHSALACQSAARESLS
jgi:hypothetical protein